MPFKDQALTFNRQAQEEFGDEAAWRSDLDSYQRGDTVHHAGYVVQPKRDLMGWPHTHGWVVTPEGRSIINTLPGATWAHSKEGALDLIAAFIAAGEQDTPECGRRFWALVRLSGKQKPKRYRTTELKFNDAGDAFFKRHDLGAGWVFDLFDDGSAVIENSSESRRIDLAPENIARLREIIQAAQRKGD